MLWVKFVVILHFLKRLSKDLSMISEVRKGQVSRRFVGDCHVLVLWHEFHQSSRPLWDIESKGLLTSLRPRTNYHKLVQCH